jgi:glycogen debranching enzyme
LNNPRTFNRSSGIASLSADSAGFTEDGQYWKGSVWPPVQCLVQEGLRVQGQWPLARALAEKYLRAVAQAFAQRPTITENLAPDRPQGYGATEFVGWGGIGPIANLIEYVLGFQVKAPERLIEWRIERLDRHGIENLTMGDVRLDLICDRRADSASPCRIAVQSSGACTLKVMVRGATTTHGIAAGRNQIIV